MSAVTISTARTVEFAKYDHQLILNTDEESQNMRNWIALRSEGKVYAISRLSQGEALARAFTQLNSDAYLVNKYQKYAATSNDTYSQEDPLSETKALALAVKINGAYEQVKNTVPFQTHNTLRKEMKAEMKDAIRVNNDLTDLFFTHIMPTLEGINEKTAEYISYKLGYVKAFECK